MPNLRQCDQCVAKCRKAGPLETSPSRAEILLVMDQPRLSEVRSGDAMTATGHRDAESLARRMAGGLRVATTYAVACAVDIKRETVLAKRADKLAPVKACEPELRAEIERVQPKVIVGFGEYAHKSIALALRCKIGKGTSGRRFGDLLAQRGHPEMVAPEVSGLAKPVCYLPTLSWSVASFRLPAAIQVIRDDIRRAVTIADKGYRYDFEDLRQRITWPRDLEDAHRLISLLERELEELVTNRLIVDIETPMGKRHEIRPHCIGMLAETTPVVFPIKEEGRDYWRSRATPAQFAELKARIRRLMSKRPIVAHNAAFDTGILERTGWIDPGLQAIDTAILYKNTDEGTLPRKSLAWVSSRASNNRLWKLDADDKEAFHNSTAEEWIYNGEDLIETKAAFHWLQKRIRKAGMLNSANIDHKVFPIFRDMSKRGLLFSSNRLEEARDSVSKVLEERTRVMSEIAGRAVNPNASNDLRKLLFVERGLKPVYSTAGISMAEDEDPEDAGTGAPALIAIQEKGVSEDDGKLIDAIIGWKTAAKLLSNFITPALTGAHKSFEPNAYVIDIGDGRGTLTRLHPTWRLDQAPTGRAASRPNVQNLPKVALANVRRCVVPPPGHVFVSADFEQIEARLYAVVAQDKAMLRAFKEGLDVHALNYAGLEAPSNPMPVYDRIVRWKDGTDKKEKERATVARLVAKIWCFALIYGAGVEAAHKHMVSQRNKVTGERVFAGLKKRDAEKWYEAFHLSHPEAKPWQRECIAHATRHGWIAEPYHGRKRYFREGVTNPNEPPNHTIQGAASGMALDALVTINDYFESLEDRSSEEGVVNFVHDEILAVAREERAEEVSKKLQDAMTFVWRDLLFEAEAEIQTAWTEKILKG